MTNINRIRLPRHKQYNWHLVCRRWRISRKLTLILAGMLLGTMMYMGEMFLLEHNEKLVREDEARSLVLMFYKLTTFGKPGYVRNDWTEGTAQLSNIGENNE